MRRLAIVVSLAAVFLVLGASAVIAESGTTKEDGIFVAAGNQKIQCLGIPCTATGSDDLVYERRGNRLNDEIYLKGGDDQVRANRYTHDRDVIRGSSGFDLIYVNDGDTHDRIYGGKGNDKCYVDARSEAVRGCSVVIVR